MPRTPDPRDVVYPTSGPEELSVPLATPSLRYGFHSVRKTFARLPLIFMEGDMSRFGPTTRRPLVTMQQLDAQSLMLLRTSSAHSLARSRCSFVSDLATAVVTAQQFHAGTVSCASKSRGPRAADGTRLAHESCRQETIAGRPRHGGRSPSPLMSRHFN